MNVQSALGEGVETVFVQPIVYANGGVAGYEALGRYITADGTVVPPNEFLPKLKAAGFTAQFDRCTASLAVQQLKAWRNDKKHFFISVNASPEALGDPTYANHLIREAWRMGITPRRITVEILENCAFYKEESYMASLRSLASAGFQLALDDFPNCENPEGLLEWLSLGELKLHKLKLDKSIAHRIESYETQLLVARYVDVAHDYGMAVVAEGVESGAQLAILHRLGVDFFQGFLFGKPQPAELAYHVTRQVRPLSAFGPALVPA